MVPEGVLRIFLKFYNELQSVLKIFIIYFNKH